MFRALAVHLGFYIVGLGLTGCFFHQPHATLRYQIDAARLKGSPPEPVALATDAPPTRLTLDTVRIEPEKAVGYDTLPTSVTQIYNRPPRDLSLADVVYQNLANNRQIKLQGYTVRIAEYQVPVSEGIYDLNLSASYTFTRNERQSGQPPDLTVSRSRTHGGNLGLTQLLPTGATVSAVYSATRRAQANYANNTAIQVTQPLLQGLGWTVTNAGIRIARLESQGSLADFQTTLEERLQLALETYWDLIGAIQALKVNIISYAAARDLMRINQTKYDVGMLAISALLQTQSALDVRYDQIIQSRAAIRTLEDRLKQQIHLSPEGPLWADELRPTQPVAWREAAIDAERMIEQGLTLRPEMRRAQSNLEQARERLKVTRNDLLPVLDFFITLRPNGLGTEWDDAYENMESGKATSYDAGLRFSYPLQNRGARFRYRQSRARVDQAEERLKDVRDQITLDVRAAARAYEFARERISISLAQIESEQANLETEQLRLQVGLSTTFRVLQFQQDLANAQLQHIQAIIDTNQAAIAVERARGTMLATYGIHPAE